MVVGGQGPGDITGLGVIAWLYLGLESVIASHDVIFHDCLRGGRSVRHFNSTAPASFFTPAFIEIRGLWNRVPVHKAAEIKCGVQNLQSLKRPPGTSFTTRQMWRLG